MGSVPYLGSEREGWADVCDMVATLYHKTVPIPTMVGIKKSLCSIFVK